MTLSLCMIVKNEEDTLARCLASVQSFVDEIIIIDTGSTDNTITIAKAFTPHVHTFAWCDDFSKARNVSFSYATSEYIMWLDADDVVLPDDAAKFRTLKETLSPTVDVVMLPYALGENFVSHRERIVRRSPDFLWHEPVHEYIQPSGLVITETATITHKRIHGNSTRNLDIMERHITSGGAQSARFVYYHARELMDHGRYDASIARFEQFLSDNLGWIEDNITACLCLSSIYEKLGNPAMQLASLLRTFTYAPPRASVCCDIGKYYAARRAFESAIDWYTHATHCRPSNGWGFQTKGDHDYIPYMEMCVCYDKLNDRAKAIECNELAATFNQNSPQVAHNRAYFCNQTEPA